MSFLRVGLRTRIDNLWQARAEKQRRLGLGLREPPPAPPSLNFGDPISCAASEAGSVASCDAAREKAPQPVAGTEDGDGDGDGGDGADRVGTLLVHMGQLDGVGGVGLLSLVPKAVATLVLEESSATLEEMDLETNVTEVSFECWLGLCWIWRGALVVDLLMLCHVYFFSMRVQSSATECRPSLLMLLMRFSLLLFSLSHRLC